MAGAIGRLRNPDQDCRRPVVRMSSERMSTFPRALLIASVLLLLWAKGRRFGYAEYCRENFEGDPTI